MSHRNPPYSSMHSSTTDEQQQAQIQHIISTCTQIAPHLISIFQPHLTSETAAFEAAITCNGDYYQSQYLLTKILQSPPVCRHFLEKNCFVYNCTFSHDTNGRTCLFWMRGRCTKDKECPFLHSYDAKLLEGYPYPVAVTNCSPVASANSRQRQPCGPNTTAVAPNSAAPPARLTNSNTNPSTNWPSMKSSSSKPNNSNNDNAPPPKSFAAIASKNTKQPSSSQQQRQQRDLPKHKKVTYAKIPQNMWKSSDTRDYSPFYQIPDPIARYESVMSNNNNKNATNKNVIDLHFQSLSTFHLILQYALEDKISEFSDTGVWVVTGSGHHVNTKSHQKGGGVLENAVWDWLCENGYDCVRGRDRNGYGGAVLVKGWK